MVMDKIKFEAYPYDNNILDEFDIKNINDISIHNMEFENGDIFRFGDNLYMLINLGFFAKESHPKRNNEIFTAFYDLCQDRNVHYRWRIRYDTSH